MGSYRSSREQSKNTEKNRQRVLASLEWVIRGGVPSGPKMLSAWMLMKQYGANGKVLFLG